MLYKNEQHLRKCELKRCIWPVFLGNDEATREQRNAHLYE